VKDKHRRIINNVIKILSILNSTILHHDLSFSKHK